MLRTALRARVLASQAFRAAAVIAIAAAAVGYSISDKRLALALPRSALAAPPGAPRLLASRQSASCKLSVGKQIQAVKAFAEMMPVFRHPRCINCHGAVDPFSDKHRGVEGVDRDKGNDQCQDCHDQLPGWRIPGDPVFFVGKSDEELCFQMKQFEHTGESFVEHLLNDHGDVQFIAMGFTGTRALDEQARKDFDVAIEPPPGTQADLVQKARKWVDIVGPDNYKASKECGCVGPRIKVEIHHTLDFNGSGFGERFEATFVMSLKPVDEQHPDQFVGDTALVPTVQVKARNCTAQTKPVEEHWTVQASLPAESDSLTIVHVFSTAGVLLGSMQCSNPSFWAALPRPQPLALIPLPTMVLPADSGASKELKQDKGESHESLKITLLSAPASR